MIKKKGFTTGEVAEFCHVTIPTVIKWIDSGELPGFKIPGSKNRRIIRESLLAFMHKHGIPTTDLEESGFRVLAVDDERQILELFEALFEGKPYELRCVSRGFDAGIAKEFKPHLVILDILLPDIDGRQVCEYIRAMPEMKEVKILGISGYVQEELEALLEKGFDDCIRKPFDNEELLRKVEDLLCGKPKRGKKKT